MTRSVWQWPGLALTALLILAIRLYQVTISPLLRVLSPLIGTTCRFEPSCSHYMIGALNKYGPIKGLAKGVGRLLRCNPWSEGGFDPP